MGYLQKNCCSGRLASHRLASRRPASGVVAKTIVGGLLAASVLAATGVAEAHRFALRQVSLDILPSGAPTLRVLHISDIHLLACQRHKRRFLKHLAALQPDLVVNTGDNIASGAAIRALQHDLGPLLKIPGFFVFGSNDYFRPVMRNPFRYLFPTDDHPRPIPKRTLPSESLRKMFLQAGWLDLNNKAVTVTVRGLTLETRGTNDAHLNFDSYPKLGPSSSDLLIGVTHAPYLRVLDQMARDDVDLIFAGHTHGGQICWPTGRALITNCDLDVERVKGLSRHSADSLGAQASWLHISGGIGSSPFVPVRLFNRPEATLLTLTANSR